MILRGLLHQRIRTCVKDRRGIPPMGKYTTWALYFAVACVFWWGFKEVEPEVFPVVKDFTITEVRPAGDNIHIYGSFNKVRDCTFVDVVGYSGKKMVTVIFDKYPGAPVVSRIVKEQTFGPWLIVPRVHQLDLYAHHICATGMVTTHLFSGALVL